MQKRTQKTTDFFSLYRYNQLKNYIFSGGISVFVAFGFVSFLNADIDTRGLMANVSGIVDTRPQYDADLILTKDAGVLTITFGAHAQKVDRINFTLLSDPTKCQPFLITNPDITVTELAERGSHQIVVNMHGEDIVPGTIIAQIDAQSHSGSSFVISDTEFVSHGQRYSITSTGE